MHSEQLDLASDLFGRVSEAKPGKVTNVAPISFHRCAAHHCLVSLDGERRLLGRCPGCAAEAARGILIIVNHILVTT